MPCPIFKNDPILKLPHCVLFFPAIIMANAAILNFQCDASRAISAIFFDQLSATNNKGYELDMPKSGFNSRMFNVWVMAMHLVDN